MQGYDSTFVFPEDGIKLDQVMVKKHLTASHKTLKKIQSSSTDLRLKSYHELLAVYDSDTNYSTKKESKRKASIATRTLRSEASRSLFSLLRTVVKPSEFSAQAKMQIPRAATEPPGSTLPDTVHRILHSTPPENLLWDTIIDSKDIESHILSFNREAFRAASELPCGHGVIHER